MTPPEKLLFERLLDALPQTQCTRCGYADCAAYAQAIVKGEAAINQCPPGGAEGVERLAALTGQPVTALNPVNGLEGPRTVAVIDEAWCIGCTLCIKACPVDAIVGSHKLMHTVIEADCTGCELCVAPCPVDCISLENVTGSLTGWQAWSPSLAVKARIRYEIHSVSRPNSLVRTPKSLEETSAKSAGAATAASDLPVEPAAPLDAASQKRAVIDAALARARAQRQRKA